MDRVLFTAAPKGQAETLAPEPPRHKWAYIVRGQGRPADTVLMGGEKMRVSPPLGKRTWTAEEENYLRESWGTVTVDGICRHLNRTKNAIMVRVNRLGLPPYLESGEYITLHQLSRALGFGASSDKYFMKSWVKTGASPCTTSGGEHRRSVWSTWVNSGRGREKPLFPGFLQNGAPGTGEEQTGCGAAPKRL